MKVLGAILLATVALVVGLSLGYQFNTAEAQTIGIEPVATIKVVGTAPIAGLAGLRIQAAAPEGVTVTCALQQRAVEECTRPSVAEYAFTDQGDLIQSNDAIDGFGVFQFTGPSGPHDIVFTVLTADDDSGNRIFYSEIFTQVTIP